MCEKDPVGSFDDCTLDTLFVPLENIVTATTYGKTTQGNNFELYG